MNVLIIGGTGMVGRLVLEELQMAGANCYLMARNIVGKKDTKHLKWIKGDVVKEEDVIRVFQTADVTHVYFHAPATIGTGLENKIDVTGTKHLLKHIPASTHLVKLSEIGAWNNPHFYDLSEKYKAEELVKQSSIRWTILRPTWFMESIPQLLTIGPFSISFGKQPHPIWWVSGRDYARTVVAAIRNSDVALGRAFTVQGPDAYRMPEAIALFNKTARTGKINLQLPLAALAIPAWISATYRFNKEVMKYYNDREEVFESSETHALHKPMTTLKQFAEQWRH